MRTCQWGFDERTDADCDSLVEGATDYCGTHNSLLRKEIANQKKEVAKREHQKAKKAIAKVGTKNLFKCSDGSKLTELQINTRYQTARKIKYAHSITRKCEGCGTFCNGSAHIIAKARCKVIGKTELIWNKDNFFPACNECNSAIENPKGQEWKKLRNIDKCMEFIRLHDKELFQKFLNNGYQAPIKLNETI